jgi:hypothetical protein
LRLAHGTDNEGMPQVLHPYSRTVLFNR